MHLYTIFPGCCPCLPPPALAVKCWIAGIYHAATEQTTQGRQSQGDPLSRPDQHNFYGIGCQVDYCKHIIADLNKEKHNLHRSQRL